MTSRSAAHRYRSEPVGELDSHALAACCAAEPAESFAGFKQQLCRAGGRHDREEDARGLRRQVESVDHTRRSPRTDTDGTGDELTYCPLQAVTLSHYRLAYAREI